MNSFWKDRPTLVTGATGFIGGNIVKRLIDWGACVYCFQRDVARPNTLDIFGLRDRIENVHGSIEDIGSLRSTIEKFEIESIFHLAAQALVGSANISPLSTFDTNIRGTYTLLEAARCSPLVGRVVVASSDKAYGSHENLPYREEFALNGLFPYDVSKACTDLLAQSFAHSYQLPVTIARSANTYGAGDLNFSRIVPGTILSVLNNRAPTIRSTGEPVREFIYIDDVVDAYLMLAEQIDESRGHAFNLGSTSRLRIIDLVEKIITIAGKHESLKPQVESETKMEFEIDAKYLSEEKIYDKFKWQAAIDIDRGLAETIDWYRDYLKSGEFDVSTL
ncbi:MAG: NAD-dependent epimerase/dehydratase family protein [Chloracidobacterium sp.]|nr:NAD-dependent epimerase/dehydratase family protein [Chloracidobacterium sp.]